MINKRNILRHTVGKTIINAEEIDDTIILYFKDGSSFVIGHQVVRGYYTKAGQSLMELLVAKYHEI